MVWQIVNKNDFEAAVKTPLLMRSPFIEMQGILGETLEFIASDPNTKWMSESIALAENMPSPRVIKSHLPIEMLPPKLLDTCKVIFVCRNPKDTCVSFYHHTNNLPGYNFTGDFDYFAKTFMDGTTEYGSYWTMLKVICDLRLFLAL